VLKLLAAKKKKEYGKGGRKRALASGGADDIGDGETEEASKKARLDESAAPQYLVRTLIDIVAMEATEEDVEKNFFKYAAGEAGENNHMNIEHYMYQHSADDVRTKLMVARRKVRFFRI
jgi:hypothetical protein